MRANLVRRPILAGVLLASLAGGIGCSKGSGASPGSSGGPSGLDAAPGLGGSGGPPLGDVAFPWPVFDGTVPDVPAAIAPGSTWYCDPSKGNDAWDGTSFTLVSGSKGPKKTLNAALSNPSLRET